jgi:tRNA A-37 threonylcarbamoyl transferase component Bud32
MLLTTPTNITKEEYARSLDSGKAGPMKHGYPAVIISADGTITKLWAKKPGWLSSSRWRRYSSRFISNAEKLRNYGVTVPQIIAHKKICGTHVYLVQYHSLPGQSIRELLEHHPEQVDIPSLAQYFYDLHEKGIIFRAIHFGNVIQTPNGKYGLIDFTDITFLKHPAPLSRRATNIATPLRYHEDVKRIEESGLPNFLKSYLSILREKSGTFNEKSFMKIIHARIPKTS